MARDVERIERLQAGMKETGLDALVCTLPADVLLLTGYFPVVGTSVALATRDCEVLLLVPEDEQDLAECCADHMVTMKSGDSGEVRRRLSENFHLHGKVIGFQCGECYEPASYISMHLYSEALLSVLDGANLRPADQLLSRMKAVLTPIELDRLRRACRIAAIAFELGRKSLAPGLKETEAAAHFESPLTTVGTGFEGVERAAGEVSCMSGVNSAKAWGAYARSRAREIEVADLALVHCNSHADGYWTDITRTYCMEPAGDRQCRIYDWVFEARRAALDRIAPGVKASDVDAAARDVMRSHGVASAFKHGTGHGVGFNAIDQHALPRVDSNSPDRLESGMVFNVEPALYFEGFGGVRHCDMVGVTESGVEVLTPFQSRLEDLVR